MITPLLVHYVSFSVNVGFAPEADIPSKSAFDAKRKLDRNRCAEAVSSDDHQGAISQCTRGPLAIPPEDGSLNRAHLYVPSAAWREMSLTLRLTFEPGS